MRRSKKSEFHHGIFYGMINVLKSATELSMLEESEAAKEVAILAAKVKTNLWPEFRAKCDSLETAYNYGFDEGLMHGWESDEQLNETIKRIRISTI